MTRPASLFALAALSLLAIIPGASAEEALKPSAIAQRLFAERANADAPMACFARVYDAAHMAQHPRQKTSAMMLLLTEERATKDSAESMTFHVGFRVRGRSTRLESAGDCSNSTIDATGPSSAHLHCSVECDGGGLEVDIAQDDKSLRVGLENIAVHPPGKYDEDAAEGFSGGADDKVFRLDRVSLRDCLPLMTNKRQIASVKAGK